jgi:cytochrome c biogenesis protein ResB
VVYWAVIIMIFGVLPLMITQNLQQWAPKLELDGTGAYVTEAACKADKAPGGSCSSAKGKVKVGGVGLEQGQKGC